MNENKIDKMDIRMRVIGIKKKQRTVKLHNIDVVVDLPYADVDLNNYVPLALQIRDNTMRTVEKCEVYLSPWTQIPCDGYSMKKVRMCDPRYKKVSI